MAENYTANKMDLSSVHGGVKYENGLAPDVGDFNKMVEGIAYAQEKAESGVKKAYTYVVFLRNAYLKSNSDFTWTMIRLVFTSNNADYNITSLSTLASALRTEYVSPGKQLPIVMESVPDNYSPYNYVYSVSVFLTSFFVSAITQGGEIGGAQVYCQVIES